jgi:predicted metal-dependent HD superfamily phosphohydrolase
MRREVDDLILFTRHDLDPDTRDGKLMVDIDLASLGLPPEMFDANGRAIREEYAHVPEDDFRRGRASLLGRFLNRPRIYLTDEFFNRYETQARQNLRRSLNSIDAA